METRRRTSGAWLMPIALLATGGAGCLADMNGDETIDVAALDLPLGSALPGVGAQNFAEYQANFQAVETINDGLGPVFNERACGNCHNNGASGGAGDNIERRYGRFVNGAFDPLTGSGGSLRQLFSVGSFTGANGQRCNAPVEVEPSTATVHNVGRLTTPLFGLGLVDSMPDSFFDSLAAAEPAAVRGVVNRVSTVLPNPRDAGQSVGGTRVGRFGWKAGVPNLIQFAADAYLNEMGISTQHCIGGVSIKSFSTESAPNGIPQPAGCDDLAPAVPAALVSAGTVQAGTDDFVGACTGTNATKLQKDVENFGHFMTDLAPPPRGTITAAVTRGQPLFTSTGCAGCHTSTTFTTPSPAPNGVPSKTAFNPFSDFLVHDMGTLGDQIGNAGDSLAVTRRMRTAPLWGVRFRHFLLHDGRTNNIATAIGAHDGQGAAARTAFQALSASQQSDLVAYVNSL
jgi:CxxC motif-containing protein (DUF1111 family)